MGRYKLLGLLTLLCFILSFTLPATSQSTYGSISGVVSDSSGAAVTGATVTLTSVATGEKRTETSGADGHYTFVNLFQGQYRIDVEKSGPSTGPNTPTGFTTASSSPPRSRPMKFHASCPARVFDFT